MLNKTKKLSRELNKDPNKELKIRFAERMDVSRAMVTLWDNDDRLVKDGKWILIKESIELIKKTAHFNGRALEKQVGEERAEIDARIEQEKTYEHLKDDVAKTQLNLETDNARELFDNARALREKAGALQAAAEHEKYIGLLVKREVVEMAVYNIMKSLKDNLGGIARGLSIDVATNNNPAECERIISKEINAALMRVVEELNARV